MFLFRERINLSSVKRRYIIHTISDISPNYDMFCKYTIKTSYEIITQRRVTSLTNKVSTSADRFKTFNYQCTYIVFQRRHIRVNCVTRVSPFSYLYPLPLYEIRCKQYNYMHNYHILTGIFLNIHIKLELNAYRIFNTYICQVKL